MGQTAVKVDVNEKYAERYADYLRTKTDREEKIKGLTLQIEQARQEIDDARIRLTNSVGYGSCSKCDSYAVIPHNEESKLRKGADKTVYQCDVCGEIKRVEISGAESCKKCHNRSLIFLRRSSHPSSTYRCEVCGHSEEYDE